MPELQQIQSALFDLFVLAGFFGMASVVGLLMTDPDSEDCQ